MAEEKKEPTKIEDEVKTLRQDLDAITFKNKQVEEIAAIQAGKQKLKDKMSKNRERRVSSSNRIAGLGKLGGLSTIQSKYKNK